jgi:hypothetical protein
MGPSIKTTESSMDAADSGGDLVSGTLIDWLIDWLLLSTKQTSSWSSHWKLTCSRHDMAEKLLS